MKSYEIGPRKTIDLSPDKRFLGSNSLLQIKVSNMPFEEREHPIRLSAVYTGTGNTFTCNVVLLNPHYFSAITPDLSQLSPGENPWFDSLTLTSLCDFSIEVQILLNTNLHSNLDDFFKTPELIVAYKGRVYLATIESTNQHHAGQSDDWRHIIRINTGFEEVLVAKITESSNGQFEFEYRNNQTGFNEAQLAALLSE